MDVMGRLIAFLVAIGVCFNNIPVSRVVALPSQGFVRTYQVTRLF